MENFTFKTLEKKDLNRVMEIEKSAFTESTWEEIEVYNERIEYFPQGNLGIWYQKKLIGFICSELWVKEKNYNKNRFMLSHKIEDYHSYEGKELYVSSFAIDSIYKGQGLGKTIFNDFMKLMIEKYSLESSILLVSEEWGNAIKIYQNQEFETIEKIENFFENDKGIKFDGIIMKKQLKG